MEAQLLLQAADAEPGRVRGHDERADLGLALVGRAGPRGHDVRAGLAGVGDEALAAVDDPAAVALVEPRGRPRAAGIAARTRLRQAVAADDLARGHRDEVALLLRVGGGEDQRTAPERGVRRDDEPE